MNQVLFGILGYILFQLLLGLLVSRSIRTEDDFLLAGRKLGYGLATFSIFATWFGAESCVGTAGAAYANGLAGATADPFGYAVCILLMGLVFAIPLWKLKLTTIADFVRHRFSVSAERLTALLMVPTSLLWAAAQIRAFGQVLSASSELNLEIAIAIAALVVIVYTTLGGLLADAMTDVVQGAVLIFGLVYLFHSIVGDSGGIVHAVRLVEPARLTFVPGEIISSRFTFFTMAEAWAIPICGSVVAQELISRVIASRSPKIAQRSSCFASILYLGIGIIPLFIGLVGFKWIPNLTDPEHVLPMMAQQHLSNFFYIIFAGALVSAILSTVDSALLAAAALVSHNLLYSFRPHLAEKRKLRINRLGVLVSGGFAFLLALHAQGIYDLVKDASSFGSSGIFIVFLFGLYTKFGKRNSAIAALISGTLVWIISHYLFDFRWSYLLSLGLALFAYLSFGVPELINHWFKSKSKFNYRI